MAFAARTERSAVTGLMEESEGRRTRRRMAGNGDHSRTPQIQSTIVANHASSSRGFSKDHTSFLLHSLLCTILCSVKQAEFDITDNCASLHRPNLIQRTSAFKILKSANVHLPNLSFYCK